MKKLLGILVLGLLWCNTAFAGYGGWIDMIVNSEEHKYCGDLSRSKTSDPHKGTDIYLECRHAIDLEQHLEEDFQQWKKENK